MRLFCVVTVLVLSTAGMAISQSNSPRLTQPGAKRKFAGLSHIEIDLGQRNALLIGFNRYAQVEAHQNVDSVLRLFVSDYQKVRDTTQSPTQATHALFRLGEVEHSLSLRFIPQSTSSFRFQDGEAPLLVKTRQDTVQIAWVASVLLPAPPDFGVYLLINNLDDIKRVLDAGGVNQKLKQSLDAIRQYKHHDLTSPKMAFNLIQGPDNKSKILNPGSPKNPFISFQPGIGVGLIRNQWVPSLNLDLHLVPSRFHNVAYTVGYISNFFFSQSAVDNRFQTLRNDFLTVGLAFYFFDKSGQTSAFSRQIFSFNVGMAVHRQGPYFDSNTIRLSGTVYQKGLFKVQPELYMNGFFKNVNPGLRVVVGL